jgi:hypothetical protein
MSKEKDILVKLFGEESVQNIETVEDLDTLVSELTEKQKAKYFEIFENDVPETVKNKIIQPFEGKFHGSLDTKLKKYGLLPDEIKGKSVSEKMQLLEEKFDEKLKTASKKEVAEMQEELLKLNQKIQDYEEKVLPQERTKAENTIKEFQINQALTSEYANIDNSSLTLGKEGRSTAMRILDFELRQKYDVKLENGDIVFYEKGTEKKAMNATGTEILKKNQVIVETLKATGLYKQSNGQGTPSPNGGTPTVTIGSNKNKEILESIR